MFLFPFFVGIVCTMASPKFAFVNYTTAHPAQWPVFMPLHSLLWYTVDTFRAKTLTFIMRCQVFFSPWEGREEKILWTSLHYDYFIQTKGINVKGSYTILKVKQQASPELYPVTEYTSQQLRTQQMCHIFCTPTYFLSILNIFEVHKCKSSWTPRLLIIHNGNISNWTILGENFSQISFCGVQTQSKHAKTTIWVRICLKKGIGR